MKSMSHQFLDFCHEKPADEAYRYSDNSGCAFAQFLLASGMARQPGVGGFSWVDWETDQWHQIPEAVRVALIPEPTTFGALADRLEAALVKASS
jgi:hypothetical protein